MGILCLRVTVVKVKWNNMYEVLGGVSSPLQVLRSGHYWWKWHHPHWTFVWWMQAFPQRLQAEPSFAPHHTPVPAGVCTMEATVLWFSHFITSHSKVLQTLREVRKVKLGCFFPATRLLSSKTTGEAKRDERLEDNPETPFLAPYLFLFWTLCSSFQMLVSRGPWYSPTADSE